MRRAGARRHVARRAAVSYSTTTRRDCHAVGAAFPVLDEGRAGRSIELPGLPCHLFGRVAVSPGASAPTSRPRLEIGSGASSVMSTRCSRTVFRR